ncbi:MAG: hypothetical protein AB7D92_00500 [Sphaerochaeta sp.]
MKKKFVLTLALVLMVAGTLVAATPIEVSGTFDYGYDFELSDGTVGASGNAGELVTLLDFTGDFWKVSLDSGTPVEYHDEQSVTATAEIYLDKALAEEGIDMGDIALTLHVGNGVGDGYPSVLADKNDYVGDYLGNDTVDLSLAMAGAPDNFGVTVKYADMVEVYASADPTVKEAPMVLGAKVMPVDGVEVAVGFTNAFQALESNAMAISAKADVAALAGLDFALAATGEFLLDLENEENVITADVDGSYKGIGLWVAFQNSSYAEDSRMAAEVSYETTVSDFDISASFNADLGWFDDDDDQEFTIGAGASYAMGGATYALDAEYKVEAETFTVSPSVSISF